MTLSIASSRDRDLVTNAGKRLTWVFVYSRASWHLGLLEEGTHQLLDLEDVLTCLERWSVFTHLMVDALNGRDDERLAVISGWLLPRVRSFVQVIPTMSESLKVRLTLVVACVAELIITPSTILHGWLHTFC